MPLTKNIFICWLQGQEHLNNHPKSPLFNENLKNWKLLNPDWNVQLVTETDLRNACKTFSKECLDTLNQALSENKQDFICVIAGYANALDTSFFSYNEGLRRRFPFRFDIQPYKPEELALILNKKIFEYGSWEIKFTIDELVKLIKDNSKYFINQGGDMESLFLNIKIVHNKRIFLIPVDEKKNLFIDDIKESINKFIKLKCSVFDKDARPDYLSHLYI